MKKKTILTVSVLAVLSVGLIGYQLLKPKESVEIIEEPTFTVQPASPVVEEEPAEEIAPLNDDSELEAMSRAEELVKGEKTLTGEELNKAEVLLDTAIQQLSENDIYAIYGTGDLGAEKGQDKAKEVLDKMTVFDNQQYWSFTKDLLDKGYVLDKDYTIFTDKEILFRLIADGKPTVYYKAIYDLEAGKISFEESETSILSKDY